MLTRDIRFLSPSELAPLELPSSEIEFAKIELSRQPLDLQKRLKALGFSGRSLIIDCACGIGHWSLAAASLNATVIGLDRNNDRLKIARFQAKANDCDNTTFTEGDMHRLPFPDASADGIFCSGVFMFVRPITVLKEFYRVIKPGGLVYINVNGAGWYWIELLRRAVKNHQLGLLRSILEFTVRTLWRRMTGADLDRTIFSRKELREMLETAGFKVLDLQDEGGIGASGVTPFYQGRYGSLDGTFEILGSRI